MNEMTESSTSNAEGAFKAIENLAKLFEEQKTNCTQRKEEGVTVEQFKKLDFIQLSQGGMTLA